MNSIPSRDNYVALFWMVMLAGLLFIGCDNSSTTGSGQVGSAVFRLEIKEATAPAAPEGIQSASASSGNPIDCTSQSIEAINCKIYDAEGTIITEETFACNQHEGRIENIPAGEDREIIVDAVSTDNILLYRGEKSGISIPAWEATDLGTIELNWVDFSEADFEGTWYGHGLYTGDWHAWFYSEMTLDASGSGSETYFQSDNTSDTITINKLEVTDNGTITSPSKKTLHGALSTDKNLMTMTGTYPEDASGVYLLMIYLKAGTTFAQSDLEGTWYGHSLVSGIYPGWEYSTLTIDGSGNSTFSSVESDGSQSFEENGGQLITSSEGIISVSDNSSVHGVMSADKNILVATETGDDQEEYFLHIFVKGGGDFSDVRWASIDWHGHSLYSGSNEAWLYGSLVHDASDKGIMYYFRSNGDSGTYIPEPNNFSNEGILTSPSTPGHGVVSIDKNLMIFTETYGEFGDNYSLAIFSRQPDTDVQFHPVYRSSIYPRIDYFADGSPADYYMIASAVTTDPGYEVRITNVPDASEDVDLIYISGWSYFFPFLLVRSFTSANGYPEPGPVYEETEYTFYIDKNGNGNLDAGEPTDSYTSQPESITQLGSVQQVSITQSNTPTITWEGIDTSIELVYRIMLFPVDDAGAAIVGNVLFISEYITPDSAGSFSYTYTGGLFEQNESLYIAIDATERSAGRIINQSRFYQKHDSL